MNILKIDFRYDGELYFEKKTRYEKLFIYTYYIYMIENDVCLHVL